MAKKVKEFKTEILVAPADQAPLKQQVEKTIEVRAKGARPKSFTLDLRVHSPASLGYYGIEGIDTAPALVSLAKVKRLDVVAVTDFFSGIFIDRVVAAAQGSSVLIVPGVDIRCQLGSCDDMILTCLFPDGTTSAMISGFLSALKIPTSAAGNKDYLTTTPFDQILDAVEAMNGVVLPSRIDKTPNRLSVLSLLVEKYGFRTFDLAYGDSSVIFKQKWPKVKFQLYSFSDAYSLAQVGSRTARVKLPEMNFDRIRGLLARDTTTPIAAQKVAAGAAAHR